MRISTLATQICPKGRLKSRRGFGLIRDRTSLPSPILPQIPNSAGSGAAPALEALELTWVARLLLTPRRVPSLALQHILRKGAFNPEDPASWPWAAGLASDVLPRFWSVRGRGGGGGVTRGE